MTQLSLLIEQHALIDTPSQVLFPWLHGISDDGPKGANMGQFFGCVRHGGRWAMRADVALATTRRLSHLHIEVWQSFSRLRTRSTPFR
jgi:hypothetical protein